MNGIDAREARTELEDILQRMIKNHFSPDAELILALANAFPECQKELGSLASVKRGYNELIEKALTQSISDRDFLFTLDRLGTWLGELPKLFADVVAPMGTSACLLRAAACGRTDLKLWKESIEPKGKPYTRG